MCTHILVRKLEKVLKLMSDEKQFTWITIAWRTCSLPRGIMYRTHSTENIREHVLTRDSLSPTPPPLPPYQGFASGDAEKDAAAVRYFVQVLLI